MYGKGRQPFRSPIQRWFSGSTPTRRRFSSPQMTSMDLLSIAWKPNPPTDCQVNMSTNTPVKYIVLNLWPYCHIDILEPVFLRCPSSSSFLLLHHSLSRFYFHLLSSALRNRCEKSLMSSITVSNCIRFYEVAEEIDASVLRDHCSNLISDHWTDFTAKDFAAMGAPLLFKRFKVRKISFLLYSAPPFPSFLSPFSSSSQSSIYPSST